MTNLNNTLSLLYHYLNVGDNELAKNLMKKFDIKIMPTDELMAIWERTSEDNLIQTRNDIETTLIKRKGINLDILRQILQKSSDAKMKQEAAQKLFKAGDTHSLTISYILEVYPNNKFFKKELTKTKLRDLISKTHPLQQRIELFQKALGVDIVPLKRHIDKMLLHANTYDCLSLVPIIASFAKGKKNVLNEKLRELIKIQDIDGMDLLLTEISLHDPKLASNVCQRKLKTKAYLENPEASFKLTKAAAKFMTGVSFYKLFIDTEKLHSQHWAESGLQTSSVILHRMNSFECSFDLIEVTPIVNWIQNQPNFSNEILPILSNADKVFAASLTDVSYAEARGVIDYEKPNSILIDTCFAALKGRWDIVRLQFGDLAPKSCGACIEYVRDLKLKANVASWNSYKNKKCNLTIESSDGIFAFHSAFPEENSDVLLLCERGSDPAPVLSTQLSYNFTHCSMDSLDKTFQRENLTLWSLRDLLPTASPLTFEMYMTGKKVSERIIQTYLDTQMSFEMKMGQEQYKRVLSISLEDTLMGRIIMGGCFLQALKRFEGENVIIAQNAGDVFMNFSDSFLSLPEKTFYFNNTGLRRRKLHKAMMHKASKASPPSAPKAKTKFQKVFKAYDDVDVFEPIRKVNKGDGRAAVSFVGFFNDPIYIGNIIPLLKSLIKRFDIYVIEANRPDTALKALTEEFGEDLTDESTGNRIHFVDMVTELKKGLSDPRFAPAHFNDIADISIASLDKSDFLTGGLNIQNLLEQNLASWMRIVTARLELSFRFLTKFFETIPVQALYACSERLASHMGAVEVANSFGVPTIDVMAVNSIRLPNYKAPMASHCTAIDTITKEYFKSFYGLPDNRIAMTGSPRLDEMLAKYKKVKKSEIKKLLNIPAKSKVVLVISQLQPIDRYISIFEQTIKAAESSPDTYIIVKLHRRENFTREEIYRLHAVDSTISERIRIVRDEETLRDIENCLKISDVVISMYSNVLREAVCVGIPIIIADYFDEELPFDYVSAGIGKAARTPEQLTQITLEFLSGKPDPVYQYKREQYFAQNPQLLSGNSSVAIANLV
jgi:hypothetical protein